MGKTMNISTKTVYVPNEFGELDPVEATVVDESYEEEVDIDFDKIWLASVLEALEQVGNKKFTVAHYILKNRDRNSNYLIQTQREIAEKCGVSLQTVSTTLRALEDADLIVGKSGIYQVNPDKLAYGENPKRMAILRVYRQTKEKKEKSKENN